VPNLFPHNENVANKKEFESINNPVFQRENFISTVIAGTSPFACTSTTVNTNLNADMVDGVHSFAVTDYAGSLTGGTTKTSGLKICYGQAYVSANADVSLSNLPFTAVGTYVGFAQEGQSYVQGAAGYAVGQFQNVTGATATLHNQADSNVTLNWQALGT